jgi:hypothetical protein
VDDAQLDHERNVGDRFIEWYNSHYDENFVFKERPQNAPDLIYESSKDRLLVEIGSFYYTDVDAKIEWAAKRGLSEPRHSGRALELKEHFESVLANKNRKDYGSDVILLLYSMCRFHCSCEAQSLIRLFQVPNSCKFKEVYFAGDFGSCGEDCVASFQGARIYLRI